MSASEIVGQALRDKDEYRQRLYGALFMLVSDGVISQSRAWELGNCSANDWSAEIEAIVKEREADSEPRYIIVPQVPGRNCIGVFGAPKDAHDFAKTHYQGQVPYHVMLVEGPPEY